MILFIVIIGMLLLIQYLGILMCLDERNIKTKKQLKYWLISFSYVHFMYTELVEKYKELD